MITENDFVFKHRVHHAAQPPGDLLGLLRGLVGTQPPAKPKRLWRGTGFNLIWRPNFNGQSGTKDFFLELNLTEETLEFTDITGPNGIANRGFLQPDIALGGLAYVQAISDSFDNSGQHFEPGVWANVPQTTNPAEPATVARMGSIPHGTTINLQGRALTAPAPVFTPASITPFTIGSLDDGKTNLVHFDEETLAILSTSRTDLARVAALTQARLTNPTLFLSDVIATQAVVETTVLVINSDISAPGSVPDAGGGIEDIAFLNGSGIPPQPNASVPAVSAIFWIETIRRPDGHIFHQLQYTQRVLLNFHGLSWPHISVATLTIA